MSLEASTFCVSSVGAAFNSMAAGDPWCPQHGFGPCVCMSGSSDCTSITGWTYTVSTYTCPMCNTVVPYGVYHVCGTVPGIGTAPYPNPQPFTITLPPPRECGLCDKWLEPTDKKLCKDCQGLVDAWRFLSRKDPEPEKDPEE